MINPKSVRIGNTVLYDGEEWQVVGIEERHITLKKGSLIMFTIFENISGVLITPEWLESVGFEFFDYLVQDEFTDSGEEETYLSYRLFISKAAKTYYTVNLTPNDLYEFGIKVVWANELILNNTLKYTYQIENLYFELTGEELKK